MSEAGKPGGKYVLRVMVEVEDDSLLQGEEGLETVNVQEIERILGEVVLQLKEREIRHGETRSGTIRDINGLKVCSYHFETTR
ncbi:MAG: hypothetical protein WC455_08915 [Dehalococcoidia bacterium]|jgi:hypothetical protein